MLYVCPAGFLLTWYPHSARLRLYCSTMFSISRKVRIKICTSGELSSLYRQAAVTAATERYPVCSKSRKYHDIGSRMIQSISFTRLFFQLPQRQLNFAYASFRYRQSPNEKKQTNFCLHASMIQSLPVLFALLVASLNFYSSSYFNLLWTA